jgi:hypothetical protein
MPEHARQDPGRLAAHEIVQKTQEELNVHVNDGINSRGATL